MESRRRISLGNQPKTPTAAASATASNDYSAYAKFTRLMEELESGVYGSVSDKIRNLYKRKYAEFSRLSVAIMDSAASSNVPDENMIRGLNSLKGHHGACPICVPTNKSAENKVVIIIDSDEEDNGEDTAISPFQDVVQINLEEDEQFCADTEVKESRGSASSSSRHAVADDADVCNGNEAAAHTDIETGKETNKNETNSVIPPNVCQDEKRVIDVESLSTQHDDGGGCSETSDAATRAEETAVVLDFDGNESDGSVVDMDISPLRDVVLPSQFGEFCAEKETTDTLENGSLTSESLPNGTDCKENDKSVSIADETGCNENEDVDICGQSEDGAVNTVEKIDNPMFKETVSEDLADGTNCKEDAAVSNCEKPDDPMLKEIVSEGLASATNSKEDAAVSNCKEDAAVSNCEKADGPMLKETVSEGFADATNSKEDAAVSNSEKADDPMLRETGTETPAKREPAFWQPEDDGAQCDSDEDGLGNIWNEMSIALKFTEDPEEYLPSNTSIEEDDDDRCDHDPIHKEDIGDVCRICGLIVRDITSVLDVQFYKAKKYIRRYVSSSQNGNGKTKNEVIRVQDDVITTAEMHPHPRHKKEMKPHQEEGFKFLCSNLVSDDPGGCILAHAPGSGKTFLIISFMQSFLARHPKARPLIVLPKSILFTWRREFEKWKVEDFPIHDFYTEKAEGRAQQLEVLKKWVAHRSVLLLGYKQLSSIVCDEVETMESTTCRNILLQQPSLLVLDEGHTPRNEDTDVLQSLAKIQTPRKIVLSGTLYQNHVREVFNVLNLVRPNFLKLDDTPSIVKRILSKAAIPTGKKGFRGGSADAFYEAVEHTLQQESNFNRKVSLIQDLREMTGKVLHYYKGDFLDELPGLVDLTVVLKLTDRQKHKVKELKTLKSNFGRSAVGCAVCLHPKLKTAATEDDAMDNLLEGLDVRDGVKTKFFLNMLSLCETNKEKVVVFSQYLTPLKFLERLLTKLKGWTLGREMFMIRGESSSEQRERAVEHFNSSTNAKVFFGSIKACGEGISLVGGSRVMILDVHLNPSVTRQAIGRAFRPGQTKVVYVYRLVAGGSPEEEDYHTCFRKEAISKLWFEWHEFCGFQDFKVEGVELQKCGDLFMESPLIAADVLALHRR